MIKWTLVCWTLVVLSSCVPETRVLSRGALDSGDDLGVGADVVPAVFADVADGEGGLADRASVDLTDPGSLDVGAVDTGNTVDAVIDVRGTGDAILMDQPDPIDLPIPAEASVDVLLPDIEVSDRPCGPCMLPNATAACIGGVCRIITCNVGFGDCNTQGSDGCEVALDTTRNCGRCEQACLSSGLCVRGACIMQRSCPPTAELGCGLVPVAGGTFSFGTSSARDSLGPITVRVSDIVVDAYEVTVSRFRRYWLAGHPTPSGPIRYPNGALRSVATVTEPVEAITASGRTCTWSAVPTGAESLPINCVNWETAMAFCAWDGGRLPTEAEFEFLGSGRPIAGTLSPRTYPWGETAPRGAFGVRTCDRAQLFGCEGDDMSPVRRVGSFDSAGGIFDLSGNIAEWQGDNGNGLRAPDCMHLGVVYDDPLCTSGMSDLRAQRGSFYNDNAPRDLHLAARGGGFPSTTSDALGFRCVRSP